MSFFNFISSHNAIRGLEIHRVQQRVPTTKKYIACAVQEKGAKWPFGVMAKHSKPHTQATGVPWLCQLSRKKWRITIRAIVRVEYSHVHAHAKQAVFERLYPKNANKLTLFSQIYKNSCYFASIVDFLIEIL